MGFFASRTLERSSVPTLLDPRFDHDSCGVGFVATLRNTPTHEILTQALTALARLEHRGAIASDGKSSDGVGIMTAIPREFLLASSGISLAAGQPLGVGVIFFPNESSAGRQALEQALAAQKLDVLAWRVVPTCEEVLGEIALSSIPVIRQVSNATFGQLLITVSADRADAEAFSPLPVVAAHRRRVLEINMTHGNLEAWSGEILASTDVIAQIDKGLGRIETPAVVIQGEQDELVNQSHGRKLAATLPHARLAMLYGGHMQPYDHPAAIAVAVRSLAGAGPNTASAASARSQPTTPVAGVH